MNIPEAHRTFEFQFRFIPPDWNDNDIGWLKRILGRDLTADERRKLNEKKARYADLDEEEI